MEQDKMACAVSVTVGLQLLLCVAACVTGSTHQNRELYVISTPNQQCPQDYYYNCSILLDYLQNMSVIITSITANTKHLLLLKDKTFLER